MEKTIISGLVSIIIPTHNRPDYIEATLKSVINQTYKEIEIILVDDNSDSSYFQYLQNLIPSLSKEIQIVLVQNDGRGGCAARNTGIRISKGHYLQFFDDDDLMLPEHIEKKVEAIKEGGFDYSACNYTFFNTDEPSVITDRKIISTIPHVAATHILSKSLPTPCFMCTRETKKKKG